MSNEILTGDPHVIYVSATADFDAFPLQASRFLKVKTHPTEPRIALVKDADQKLWSALGIFTASLAPVFLPSLVVNLDSLKMSPSEFMNQLAKIMDKMPTLTIGLLALLAGHDSVTSDETAPLLPNVQSKQILPPNNNYDLALAIMNRLPTSKRNPLSHQ